MKRLKFSSGVWFAMIVGFLFVAGTIMAQLQQSGGPGSTVTANAGTNLNTSALALETGGNLATLAGTVSAAKVNITGTLTAVTAITNALPAGTNVLGTVNTIPKTACGNTVASSALAAVPTSSTAVFSATTCLQVVVVNNTNSSAATVTVTDNAGTPINDVLTFSIPANSQLIQPLWGVQFTSGVKWTASGTGLTGAVLGYQ